MNLKDSYQSGASRRQLAAGILKQAAEDLRRFHNLRSKIERELYFDAYRWATSDDYSWPFSFLNVCLTLNRAPEEVRQELVGDLAFRPLGQWARRCNRAVRRLVHSLSHHFATEYNPGTPMPAHLVQTWH
jgi:hypothetical protein